MGFEDMQDCYYHNNDLPRLVPHSDSELITCVYEAETTAHMMWIMWGPEGVHALIQYILASPDFDGDFSCYPDVRYANANR